MQRPLFSVIILTLLSLSAGASGRTYHVSPDGSDVADGSAAAPLRTINAAAQKAHPGDTVTVHAGTYREWVNPLYGGTDEGRRIIYQAAEGEKVEIKGSEVFSDWKKDKSGIWTATIPNSFFGNYNPFAELIWGDWFSDWGRKHHTAEVYLNEISLYEVASKDDVYSKEPVKSFRDPDGSTLKWFAEVDAEKTVIYADFGTADPRKDLVEITVRPTCFYPTREGLNYITIKGFHISQAATQWGAPTAEQIGMVATHWCKGWIIEDNVISNSRCNGISLGKEASTGHNVWTIDPGMDGCPWYIETTLAAVRAGWTKDRVGSHIVRNNEIFYCEQTGIVGSLGSAFCQVYGNNIHDIWCKRQFDGAEIAAIKFHGAIDAQIHNNCLHDSKWGLWLDWMAQGSRVSSNLMYGNQLDMFYEVDHGPFVFDNNILLSGYSLLDGSENGAYVHNYFGGFIVAGLQDRHTPYQEPHSTEVRGSYIIEVGNSRFYNNIFAEQGDDVPYGLKDYKDKKVVTIDEDNVFLGKTDVKIETVDGNVYLEFPEMETIQGKTVTTERLGYASLTRLPYENADGSPIVIDRDYLGNSRYGTPAAGPLENYKGKINAWVKTPEDIDDNLVVFISDLHTDPNGYQPAKLGKVVSDILAMKPLPRNVIALGDLAYLTGKPSEYAALKPILAPLEEAGITLTLGMGNHDRRAEFGEAFPDQAAKSVMKDRYVYIVETPYADFIVMDSLQEGEDKTKWITPGALNDEQKAWIEKTLADYPKPVFVCSHHGLNETGITKILAQSPNCCGYIYGHFHRWRKDWTEVWGNGHHVVRTLCMPSTGHWGDIGYVTMKIDPVKAVATLHESDFFFPSPAKNPADVPTQWKAIPEEYNGDICTFTLK